MVNQLLLPGHVEHVAGFAAFRAIDRGRVRADVDPGARLADLRPLFGLRLFHAGDRRLGRRPHRPAQRGRARRTCDGRRPSRDGVRSELPARAPAADHWLGAAEGQYLGAGRQLYPPDDEARRTRGFAIFSTAINFGAVAGPLLCGFLGERYGWHVGFGAAALFMLGALATYLSGYRYLPARVERRARNAHGPLTANDRKAVVALIGVMAITVFAYIAYYQLANVLPVWLQSLCRPECRHVPDPDPVVLLDRPVGQHPERAVPLCIVGLAGAGARPGAFGAHEDRDWSVPQRRRQSRARRRDRPVTG